MKTGRLTVLVFCLLVFAGSVSADSYRDATAKRDRVVEPEYFGMHFHGLTLKAGDKGNPTAWPSDMQIGATRLWDTGTRWADIAPQPGQWNFDRLDANVTAAAFHRAQVLYVFGSTPRWASTRPNERCPYGYGCAAEPVRMAHWEEYVRRVVTRHKGQIQAYEVWNEPNVIDNFPSREVMAKQRYYFSGSIAQLVEMTRIARRVLDKEDPDATLATPGIVNAPIIMDQFLSAGGGKYVQAIAYHFYSQRSEDFVKQIIDIRKIIAKHGLEKLPVWNTETGMSVPRPGEAWPPNDCCRSYEEAAARTAQLLVLGAEVGLQRFYYYAYENGLSGVTVPYTGERRIGYESMQRIQGWLLGGTTRGCKSLGRNAVRCDIQKRDEHFAIIWGEEDRVPVDIVLPAGQKFRSVEPAFGIAPTPRFAKDGTLKMIVGLTPVLVLFQ